MLSISLLYFAGLKNQLILFYIITLDLVFQKRYKHGPCRFDLSAGGSCGPGHLLQLRGSPCTLENH